MYMAKTSNNRVIKPRGLYCCFLPQYEAPCAFCLSSLIATKWCWDQDVKAMTDVTFTKKACNVAL